MNNAVLAYAELILAILTEVVGTSFLMKSKQFSVFAPSFFAIFCYAGSLFLLSHTLRAIPLGVAYAIWGGAGIVVTALLGAVVFRQPLDTAAISGIAMIIVGIVILNVFSHATGH